MSPRRRALTALVVGVLGLALLGQSSPPAAGAPVQDETQIVEDLWFETSDGVSLMAKLGGVGPLVDGHLPARPLIVEFSPYRPGCCPELGGPAYNYLQVHIRGTGDSDGSFDALGDITQRDVVEVLDWACGQPWSNGRIGLYGFSASAITVYNSLHLELPCVETAVLGAGTHELYRDLMYPGGIPNQVPAIGVLALIGAPSIQAGPDRLGRAPLSVITTTQGMLDVGTQGVLHPSLDEWWQERGMRGDVNDLPMLLVNGFFDVESRGAFQTFQELREDGTHLMVVGAHDGVPAGSGGSDATRQRWYDRYLRDVDNGVDREPAVQLWMADGDRVAMLNGQFVRAEGEDWPLPGTTWTALSLDPTRSGTASSLNDGTLSLDAPAGVTTQQYAEIPSLPSATDPHTSALLGFFNGSTMLTDMSLVEPLGLSYTTAPFESDVVSAGPAALELALSSTAPETDIYAVISDVAPDGSAHPVATGRLRSSYPNVDDAKSLHDANGTIVQPYGVYAAKTPVALGTEQLYRVELWPIGNRFRAGHRLRLHIVGASAFHTPSIPALNAVRLGGEGGSRLLIPVLSASTVQPAAPVGRDAEADVRPISPSLPATGGGTSWVGPMAGALALGVLALRRRLEQ